MMGVPTPFQPSGQLGEMRNHPLVYGEVFQKGDWTSPVGTREVIMGPKSPPRQSTINDSHHPPIPSGHASTSTSSVATTQTTSHVPSRSTIPTSPPSDRKGKSPVKALYPAEIDLSWPQAFTKRSRAAGLYNPSMACYANATLQVLLHTPPLLRIAQDHDPPACVQQMRGFCMLCLLRDMARGEHWNGTRHYRPQQAHHNLHLIKKGFSKNKQEDTHEFFRFVTDGLQNSALAPYPKDIPEKLKHTSWVHRVWGGVVRSRVICGRCEQPSDTFDSFLDLSLDVDPQRRTLQNMLEKFVKKDRLEGANKYRCEKCKVKAEATKSFKISTAPPILTLHLKRFSVNYNAWNGKARADKFTGNISFPQILDIAPYMVDTKVGGTRYRLFAVTCHRGSELRFGHYFSYVRSPNGSFHKADDEDMDQVRIDEVLSDSSAYLLSYSRIADDGNEALAVQQNGNRPAQTPTSVYGGPSPSANPSQLTPSANGHRPTVISNGHTSPAKRKHDDDYINGDRDPKRPHQFSPSHASTYSPSRRPISPERNVDRFGYKPNKNRNAGSMNFQTEQRNESAKSRRGGKNGKGGDHRRGSGAPMPFNQGGFGQRSPGMIKRMQPRQAAGMRHGT